MPIPKPKKDESKKDYISRCAEDETMNKEYPDSKQRVAVCSTTYDESKNKKYIGFDNEEVTENKLIWKGLVNKQVKEVSPRVLRFIWSNEKIDTSGEKVNQKGWIFDRFDKNPIVIAHHNIYSDPVAMVVSRGYNRKTRESYADIEFPTSDISSRGDSYYKLYKNGFMRGVSPGFLSNVKKMEYGEKENEPRLIHNEMILCELSLVSIPDNMDATSVRKSFNQAIEKGILDDLEVNELIMDFNYEINVSNSIDDNEIKNIKDERKNIKDETKNIKDETKNIKDEINIDKNHEQINNKAEDLESFDTFIKNLKAEIDQIYDEEIFDWLYKEYDEKSNDLEEFCAKIIQEDQNIRS